VTDDAEIIPLPSAQPLARTRNQQEARLETLTVRPADWRPRTCAHERSVVSQRARTLQCRDCGVDLDPIDVLSRLANQRERELRDAMHVRRELDYLRAELERLRREERNAKSRIRTARRRRDDRHALEAAAAAGVRVDSYREWDQLNDGQREGVLQTVRTIVEAYAGALDSTQMLGGGEC
jgi:chromosome segregation ATPase